jgi:hypothetical protein
MCEHTILFQQCIYIFPYDDTQAVASDFPYDEALFYVYVEAREWNGRKRDVIIETRWRLPNDNDGEIKELLPNGTQTFDVIRQAIRQFDALAPKVVEIAEENKISRETL